MRTYGESGNSYHPVPYKIRVGLMMTPITTAAAADADKLAVQQQSLLDDAEKRAADALDGIGKDTK
ncbi:hypothetical protein DSCO28_37470 [Desulfosarcina ovata subsp. sediminis]|uniref:Uncharacterized protein n=1 Tax=Desulfosarcina ovata subsp. sediminis TaxID=885957 RepID=A0A5K7ZSJ5_9BACT|nr:hypothetical protein DSCO28_37470 [Desulfosarcina ovata subsp. sediminis]